MTSLAIADAGCFEASVVMMKMADKNKDYHFSSVNNHLIFEGRCDVFSLPFAVANNISSPDQDELNDGEQNYISDKHRFIKELENLKHLEGILNFPKNYFFENNQRIVKRLNTLINAYDENIGASLESLKSMLIFLITLKINFKHPVITLNENGTFQINWKQNNLNLVTLRFKENNSVDYVIFKPSQYTKNPIVLNGNMNIFDFIEQSHGLGIVYLIQGLNR
ncbi:MAG: hypothetical protein GQ547_02265 [Methylophaga sp.]|nr:hypothetical protein [Methylophaga sp.]